MRTVGFKLLGVLALLFASSCSKAQDDVMAVHWADGQKVLFHIEDVDSVTFMRSDQLADDEFFKKTPAANTVLNGLLESDDALTLPLNYIRRNTLLTASVSGAEFETVQVGLGHQKYMGYWLEVNRNYVHVYRNEESQELIYRYAHRLAIKDNLNITIDFGSGEKANVLLSTDGASSAMQVPWWGGGAPFLQNKGKKPLHAVLSFIPKDAYQPVWFFADSYFAWTTPTRWPYYMYVAGITSWMASHQPGLKSAEAIESFKNSLRFGTPKYAVWCMGMNDDSDGRTEDNTWKKCVDEFLAVCEQHHIVPILTTIPSVPSRNHRQKSRWVRESGYRYIDFAKAVGSDENVQWSDGMLSEDGVHPAPDGAKALYERVMMDFPEIAE